MLWDELGVPPGVSVWLDAKKDAVLAAAYVYGDGFEWCQRVGGPGEPPVDAHALAARPGRRTFPLFDDEKTIIVGPLEFARGFLRALITADLPFGPGGVLTYSWPAGTSLALVGWPLAADRLDGFKLDANSELF